MAEVFLAKLEGIEGFERRLAIKRILPSYSKNDSFVQMFIDEARLVGHFNHPNIVQIYDFGKIDGSYYISMEYVEGINIADILTRYKAANMHVPLEVILEIAIQVCRGIDYAHRETDEMGRPLGIIHRDLTPHNILISKKGVAKITDFGIAKASMNTHMTQAGMIKGKVPYMSPEQAMGMPLTHVSDIFSVGIVTYEMCTLKRLFEGENDFTILRKVQEARVPSIVEQNPNIPPELEVIVRKALARDRTERYQWASEMEADLTRLKFALAGKLQTFTLAEFVQRFIATQPVQRRPLSTQPVAGAPAQPVGQPAGHAAAQGPAAHGPAAHGADAAHAGAPGGQAGASAALGGALDRVEGRSRDAAKDAFSKGIAVAPTVAMDANAMRANFPNRSMPPGELQQAVPNLDESLSALAASLSNLDDPLSMLRQAGDENPEDENRKTVVMSIKDAPSDLNSGKGQADKDVDPTIRDTVKNARKGRGEVSATGARAGQGLLTAQGDRDSRRRFLLLSLGALVAVLLGVAAWMSVPRTATLAVEISPGEAEIFLNGEKVGTGTQFVREGIPGGTQLNLKITRDGFKDYTLNRVVDAGVRYRVPVQLEPIPRFGALLLETTPAGATVMVDGKEVGTTPVKLSVPAEKPYEVAISLPGYKSTTQSYTLKASESQNSQVVLEAEGATTVTTPAPAGATAPAPNP